MLIYGIPRGRVGRPVSKKLDNWDFVMVTIWDLGTGHRYNWPKLDSLPTKEKKLQVFKSI